VGHLSDATINKITHENALKLYRFDAFPVMGGRQNCTVAALRELGKDIDTTPRAGLGGAKPRRDDGKPITSGDMGRLMAGAL